MIRCGSCGEENPPRARFCLACAAPLIPTDVGAESRRFVTVLFADLVSSTTIGERLDAEAFRALQARYFAALREVIERHGGTVEKYIGDAVMAVFGLPTLHEDDALRAVRAAADLAPALEPLNGELDARHGIKLELRIGVHTGEVVAADTADRQVMVSGDTVNTAARLEAAAQPGEILLGPLTFELVRDAIAAEVLEDLALRGRDEPLKAYRLLAITGTEAHLRRLDTPLVGRRSELRVLRAAFDRVVDGPGCELVTVLAQAGTGKSRLVREFLDAVKSDATILRGRCLNYGDGITYWALGEILRGAAAVEETDDPGVVRTKIDALVSADRDATRVASILASVLGVAPESASADDIAWAVRRTLTLLATERPLVVLVEDIHWAEPALLDLLEAVVDWGQGAPILLLCPARPELLESRADWAAGRPRASILQLEALDPTLASELIDVLPGGTALPGKFRDRILDAAEGNPLFVEEFVAMLVDDGHLRQAPDGSWMAAPMVDDVPVPRSISLLLAARLDTLDPSDRHVAERASVVGRVFERGAVTELSPVSERGSLGGRLLSLTRRQVIRPDAPGLDGDDAFRFRHVLIRDAAYEALTKAERADLHERFARWLEQVAEDRLPEYAEIYAYHLAQAAEYRLELGTLTGADGERLATDALRASTKAGERSEQLNAWGEALRHYRRAIGLHEVATDDGSVDKIDLMARAGRAAGLDGRPAEAVDLVGQAATLAQDRGDDARAADLNARLAEHLLADGQETEAYERIDLAQRLSMTDGAPEQQADVLARAARLIMMAGRIDDSIVLCDLVIATTQELGPSRARASALTTKASGLGALGRIEASLPVFDEARREAEAVGDGFELSRNVNNLSLHLERLGRLDEAERLTEEGIALMSRYGLERSEGRGLTLNLAYYRWVRGRPAEARALAQVAIESGISGYDAVQAHTTSGAAATLLADFEDAARSFELARALAATGTRAVTLQDLATWQAEDLIWQGRILEARGFIEEAIAQAALIPFESYLTVMTYGAGLHVEADAAVAARLSRDRAAEFASRERARQYAATAARIGRETGVLQGSPGLGEATLLLCEPEALRAEGEPGVAAWRSAVDGLSTRGIVFLHAYALLRLAEALAQSGAAAPDIEAVIQEGNQVATGAHEPVRRELDALAERLGIDLPSAAAIV